MKIKAAQHYAFPQNEVIKLIIGIKAILEMKDFSVISNQMRAPVSGRRRQVALLISGSVQKWDKCEWVRPKLSSRQLPDLTRLYEYCSECNTALSKVRYLDDIYIYTEHNMKTVCARHWLSGQSA